VLGRKFPESKRGTTPILPYPPSYSACSVKMLFLKKNLTLYRIEAEARGLPGQNPDR